MNNLRPEDVFGASDTPDDLRRHISILSFALGQCSYGQPTSSQLPEDEHGTIRGVYNVLRHISTLLTIGTVKDYTAASVNAVTGVVEPDRVLSIVAAASSSGDPQLEGKAELAQVPIGDAEQAKRLLEHWPETPEGDVTFDQHLRDVATILSYLLQRPPGDARRSDSAMFHMFLTRRAFRTLSARLDNARNIWGQDPIALMQQWFDENPAAQFNHVELSLNVNMSLLPELLEEHGVRLTDGRFAVTVGNVRGWLSAISSILNYTRGRIPLRSATPPTQEECALISLNLDLLNALLDSSLLTALEYTGAAVYLHENYKEQQKQKCEMWRTNKQSKAAGMPNAARPSNDEAAGTWDNKDTESFDREPGEQALRHLERYLRTITAWSSACTALLRLKMYGVPLVLYRLHTAPGVAIPQEVIKSFMDKYLAVLEKNGATGPDSPHDNASALLFKVFRQKQTIRILRPPPIHAETTLMALAHSSVFPISEEKIHGMENIQAVFSGKKVIVGVSKKCCVCCNLFAKYITANTPNNARLEFVLPGTHAIVYPWSAPRFGVPREVLLGMRKTLFEVFHHVATTLDPSFSTQSSLASDTNTGDEDDVGLTWEYCRFIGINSIIN